MKNKTCRVSLGVAILAICALCLSSAAGARKQVTRPYKITGDTVGQITAVNVDGSIAFTLVSFGDASHCGQYRNVGTATLSLVTGVGGAEGTFVADNGDMIYWVGVIEGTTLTVTGTGGTGRFASGSGGFVAEISNLVIDPFPPVVGGAIAYSFAGAGTLTY